TSICNEYSIQAYPYNTFFFLYTLRSFAGLDGIRYWTQPLEFPNYVNWIMIPSRHSSTGFRDFGWGDIWHFNNELRTLKLYSHMAQTLHLYGENRPARMVMALLKGKNRNLDQLREMQFLPLLMTGFRANTAQEDAELVIQRGKIAEFFPSYGLMVARSGMGEDDTYFSCKTGATQTGHQHYDENSFVLYKKGYLALDTGTRNNLPHHKAYYPQSVAHNTMLVRIPGQPLPRHWYPQNAPKFPEGLTNDGGQNQQGKAKHLGFYCNEFYAATAGDAALCYPKGTVQEATRIFVFVKPDHCVIYDRMETVPNGKKVFLLHTQGELQQENGIWTTAAEEGKLFLRTLLPAKVKHEIVGGEGKEFMTNGVNYPVNPDKLARYNGKVWLGKYRLELSPEKDDSSLRMLHLLQAADGKVTEATPAEVIQTATHDGVKFQTADGAECTVLFARTGKAGGTIKITRDGKVLTERTLW
ncbi:MAG: heparinase II/III family protein, partial [Lentisphaeria bacterium]|nr:heparinase II/III family protein [Lentisphaeria bacterium]